MSLYHKIQCISWWNFSLNAWVTLKTIFQDSDVTDRMDKISMLKEFLSNTEYKHIIFNNLPWSSFKDISFLNFFTIKEHIGTTYKSDISYLTFQILLSMIFLVMVYFMNGLPAEWYRFSLFCLIAITVCLVAEGLGLAIGSVFNVTVSTYICNITL
jgi:hypothetical protein